MAWCHVDTKLHLKASKNVQGVLFWLLQPLIQSPEVVFKQAETSDFSKLHDARESG